MPCRLNVNTVLRLWSTLAPTVLVIGCSRNADVEKRKYFESGNQYFARKGDDAKARRILQKALQLDPRFLGAAQARKTLATLVY